MSSMITTSSAKPCLRALASAPLCPLSSGRACGPRQAKSCALVTLPPLRPVGSPGLRARSNSLISSRAAETHTVTSPLGYLISKPPRPTSGSDKSARRQFWAAVIPCVEARWPSLPAEDPVPCQDSSATYAVFDLLYDRFESLQTLPLRARRHRLKTVVRASANSRLVILAALAVLLGWGEK